MKVLFVPNRQYAHVIPLVLLNQMLDPSRFQTAFLMSNAFAALMRPFQNRLNFDILDIDFNESISSELMAYAKFKPDVVVDDLSRSTGYCCQLTGKPRVTIQRTGIFPGMQPRNMKHRHSSEDAGRPLPDVSHFGLQKPRHFSDLFQGDIKIVPGVRSLEVLSPRLAEDPTYYFSGPLIPGDFFVTTELKEILESSRDQRKVFFAYGGAEAPSQIHAAIESLLAQGMLVFSVIISEHLRARYPKTYIRFPFLPLHFLCSRVDLVIHHCGSGTYHFPIEHLKKTIIIGSRCYDRDDVAWRLQTEGVADYVADPSECEDFLGDFKAAVDRAFAEDAVAGDRRVRRMNELKREIRETCASFSLEKALEHARAVRLATSGK